MRALSLGFLFGFLLIGFLSCKNDSVKVERVSDKKESGNPEISNERKRINTSEASVNIGREVILTGYVADVTIRDKVSYLNFDNKYPKHSFTGVVFASDYGKIGDLSIYESKQVELTGVISEYNGKPQMIINSPGQIKIVK